MPAFRYAAPASPGNLGVDPSGWPKAAIGSFASHQKRYAIVFISFDAAAIKVGTGGGNTLAPAASA